MVFWNRLEKLDLRLQGDFIAVFMYLVGEYVFLRRQSQIFFRGAQGKKRRGAQAATEEILIRYWEEFLTVGLVKHWNRLPRQTEISSPGNVLHRVPNYLLQVALNIGQDFGDEE